MQVPGTDIYAYGHLAAKDAVGRSKKVLSFFGHDAEDLSVEVTRAGGPSQR